MEVNGVCFGGEIDEIVVDYFVECCVVCFVVGQIESQEEFEFVRVCDFVVEGFFEVVQVFEQCGVVLCCVVEKIVVFDCFDDVVVVYYVDEIVVLGGVDVV